MTCMTRGSANSHVYSEVWAEWRSATIRTRTNLHLEPDNQSISKRPLISASLTHSAWLHGNTLNGGSRHILTIMGIALNPKKERSILPFVWLRGPPQGQ